MPGCPQGETVAVVRRLQEVAAALPSSFVACDAHLRLPVQVVDVDGLAVGAEGVPRSSRTDPRESLLVVALDLLDALWTGQLV